MDKRNPSSERESDSELCKLHRVINDIDSMCQIQLGQISALSTSMLRGMETQEFWRHPSNITELVGLVMYLADDLMNYVNATAEAVGSNYVDEIERARESRVLAAFRAASNAEACHA
ncbi:hypothetical protein [Burkholderia sp. Ac-20353]|uniref:hypothetical protein n=1 Tax=Burkholderia sp. Ac-20353 TaxID=2703894 RepID=UPI00197B3424|nr:hypothetical protein [Burkholderia sp. Ac-20353]MBN3788314.1 hypothetical protein [Burkholderia sp. Ac-20353]